MHLILAVLAAGLCGLIGILAAGRLQKRENSLMHWQEALVRMENAITHGQLPLPDVLMAGGERVELLNDLAKHLQAEPVIGLMALWRSVEPDDLLTEPEWALLTGCMEGLSATSLEMQRTAVHYAREQWVQYLTAGRMARERNARLYQSLGWLCGAALFILLC